MTKKRLVLRTCVPMLSNSTTWLPGSTATPEGPVRPGGRRPPVSQSESTVSKWQKGRADRPCRRMLGCCWGSGGASPSSPSSGAAASSSSSPSAASLTGLGGRVSRSRMVATTLRRYVSTSEGAKRIVTSRTSPFSSVSCSGWTWKGASGEKSSSPFSWHTRQATSIRAPDVFLKRNECSRVLYIIVSAKEKASGATGSSLSSPSGSSSSLTTKA
mmetsp:Transcript_32310/g.82288  ORF Transcript_32310/g.82288 Transcript_32310/m.82288 type:complete len:215 (-) Transcript_32310:3378-4022(-)